jgi:hypothetical protein
VRAVTRSWCEEGGWTDRAKEFGDLTFTCASCYRAALRRHKRLGLPKPGNELSVGEYDQEITAALASDLAGRVLGYPQSELNFADEMLRDLVPIYGGDVVAGLNRRLPKRLREGIARQVEQFA